MSRTRKTVWGLIADVHGNLPALERAIALLRSNGAQRLAFLGDYLGRGDSDGCVRLIRASADIAVVGNRDYDWQDRVSAESKAWVQSLPRLAVADGLLLVHGDQRLTPGLSTTAIASGFKVAWTRMEESETTVLAFGHSHRARTWRKTAAADAAELLSESTIALDADARFLLNVGTTGLPFPGKGGPSVALVDFSAGLISHLAL